MSPRKNIGIFIAIVALAVVLDQATKAAVRSALNTGEAVHAIPGLFDIYLVYNEGAAFSMLQHATPFFLIIAVLVCVGVVLYLIKGNPQSKLVVIELSMIAAGALGNTIDRIANQGRVTDFIATVFMDFAIFNVADIFVTVGCIMLIITVLAEMFKGSHGAEDEIDKAKAAGKALDAEGDAIDQGRDVAFLDKTPGAASLDENRGTTSFDEDIISGIHATTDASQQKDTHV